MRAVCPIEHSGPVNEVHPARRVWLVVEPVHAVTYFDDRCRAAADELGLKGFWMGYFAFRAAPLGEVGPAPVEAIFAGFLPRWVARALPDAWGYASAADCLAARSASAAAALRRVGVDDDVAVAAGDVLAPVVAGLVVTGRPLAAANRALALPEDPVERLWQLTTTLREHRGDGHVAALVAAGLSGLDAHLLQVAAGEATWGSRGWSDDERGVAETSLRSRGLLERDGALTRTGVELRAGVEATTDDAAWAGGLADLGEDGVEELEAVLGPAATGASSLLWFPNPIGLPARG
jgi:hypothetical protein